MDGDQGGLSGRFAARALIPGGFWLLVFFLAPFTLVVMVSFGTPAELGGALYGWYPENYSRVFDPLFIPVLARSVGYALVTVALCLLLGYPVAYYIARFGGRRKQILIALVVLPFFVNYLIRTYAWVALLSDEGVINGLLGESIRFLNTPWAVILGLVYGYLAFMILPVYAALDRMDPALIEAGKDLYGSELQDVHARHLADDLPGRAGRLRARVPARGRRLRGRPAAGRAGHLHGRQPDPAAVLRRRGLALRRRADRGDDAVPAHLHGLLPALGGARGTDMRALRLYTAAFYAFMFMPLVVVVLFSFNSVRSLQNFDGFSLQWYRAFLENESLRGSLIASLEIALATMLVATVLGTLLAFGLVRARTRFSASANILMLIPLVTPEIVAGVSAFLLFTQIGLRLSLLTIVIAHITFSISYVTVVVRARLASLNPEVEQAALDLGATRIQTLRLVVMPALWPAILAAGLLVFALSFDDFVLSYFTTGESPQPLPVRIWSAIRFGVTPTINAIGTLMLVISLAAVALGLFFQRERKTA